MNNIIKLNEKWKSLNQQYDVKNGQNLVNIQNYIFEGKQVVSLFLAEGEVKENLFVLDKMFKDYSKITKNLALLYYCCCKNNTAIHIYIIKDKAHQSLTSKIFFVLKDKLYCFVFAIKNFEKSFVKLKKNNQLFSEVLKLIEEQK